MSGDFVIFRYFLQREFVSSKKETLSWSKYQLTF